ncbi:hypothetical protein E4U53_002757 [Claviceps sorghi]|nr:hypothetical protein E4U53_002757 [Claviceps sorghi]
MPADEPKPVEPIADKGKQADDAESASEADEPAAAEGTAVAAASSSSAAPASKKKKSKRKKAKQLLSTKSEQQQHDEKVKKAIDGLSPEQMKDLVSLNPGLMHDLATQSATSDPSPDQVAAMLKGLKLSDIMTGLAASGKNVKDMGAYKFWQTQPVPRFGEEAKKFDEGPLKVQTVEEVDKEPQSLVAGFDWVTVDLTDDAEMKEVYELLNGHYVEDDEAMFRFNYIPEVLRCVNPLYYVTFTTATLCASFILFSGFNTTDPVNTLSLLCGFLVTFAGVYLLNLSRGDPNGSKLISGRGGYDATPTDMVSGFQTRRSMQSRRSGDPSRRSFGNHHGDTEGLIRAYDEEEAAGFGLTDLTEDSEDEQDLSDGKVNGKKEQYDNAIELQKRSKSAER